MSANEPAARRTAARGIFEAGLVCLLVLAYLWPFRLYGLDVVDEGAQLGQIARVAHGARPYVDFETAYTPGYFRFYGALWRAAQGGPANEAETRRGLAAVRTFAVSLQAVTVGLLFALVRARAGRLVAGCAALLYVAFLLPISLRTGAPFNVPYPGWIAALLALLAQALVAETAARGARAPRVASFGRAIVAGALAGAAFSVKPNAGLLVLGGVVLGASCGWPATAIARGLSVVLRAGALGATFLLLRGELGIATVAALLVPVALAAFRAGPRAAERGGRADGAGLAPLVELFVVGLGFAVVVSPWAGPLLVERGVAQTFADVLFLDGGIAAAYVISYPLPLPSTVAFLAGLAVAAAAAQRLSSRDSQRGFSLAPTALGLGLLAAAALGASAGPRATAEDIWLWLGPAVLVLGLATVSARSEDTRERVLLVFGAMYQIALYPRPDMIHVALDGAVVLLAAATSWNRLTQPWRARPRTQQIRAAVAVVVILLAVARLLPSFAARLREPVVKLDAGPRAPYVIAERHAADWRWLGEAIRGIEERSAPGAPVFTFPDLSLLPLLSGRTMPFFFTYYVPGRPSHAAEPAVIARLESLAPALAVVGPPRVPAFAGTEAYFARILDYVRDHYDVASQTAECAVLVRREVRGAGELRSLVMARDERRIDSPPAGS